MKETFSFWHKLCWRLSLFLKYRTNPSGKIFLWLSLFPVSLLSYILSSKESCRIFLNIFEWQLFLIFLTHFAATFPLVFFQFLQIYCRILKALKQRDILLPKWLGKTVKFNVVMTKVKLRLYQVLLLNFCINTSFL